MHHPLSRRNWLRNTALAAGTLPFVKVSAFAKNGICTSNFPHTQVIELNANENPYGPSERARLAIMESLSRGNRYPIEWRAELKAAIAKKEGLQPENVMLGAGSSEILGIAATRFGRAGGNIVAVDQVFSSLMKNAAHLGTTWKKTALDQDFRHDFKAFEKAIDRKTELVYFCNPNNPTSTMVKHDDLVNFCNKVSPTTPIFVDEAYIEYTPEGTKNSVAELVKENQNIIIARTFSKLYGLAGMRIGYALAHTATIKELQKYHSGYELSVSSAGMKAALASLNDTAFVDYSRQKNDETRQYFCSQLDKWDVGYAESVTSFVFFPVERFQQKNNHLGKAFLQEGIACRPFPLDAPKWCRMTLGTMEEMEKVVHVMKALV